MYETRWVNVLGFFAAQLTITLGGCGRGGSAARSLARVVVENKTNERCKVEISLTEFNTNPTSDPDSTVRVGSERLRQLSVNIEPGKQHEFTAESDSACLLGVNVSRG